MFQGEDQIEGAGSHSSTEFFFVYYRLTIKRYKIFDAAVTFYTPEKPAEGQNYFFLYKRHIHCFVQIPNKTFSLTGLTIASL